MHTWFMCIEGPLTAVLTLCTWFRSNDVQICIRQSLATDTCVLFPLEYQRPSYQMRRVVIPPSYVQVASELEMCDLQTGIEALAANHGAQSETQRIEQQEMSFNKRPSPVSPVRVAFSFSLLFSCHLGITEACFSRLSSLRRD